MKTFKLDNEPKIEAGFAVPDTYFDNFSSKLLAQLPQEETKVISLFQKRKKVLMMIAAVLVMALMIPVFYKSDPMNAKVDPVALENYITYQSSVNQYDLLNNLDAEDLEKINTSIVLEDESIEEHFSTNANLENLILE
jgi:hypothetical protein